jgi:hypothetical protein
MVDLPVVAGCHQGEHQVAISGGAAAIQNPLGYVHENWPRNALV